MLQSNAKNIKLLPVEEIIDLAYAYSEGHITSLTKEAFSEWVLLIEYYEELYNTTLLEG